jgi:hypothetical protein
MVLCRLIEGFVTVGSSTLKQRHLRQMGKLDAANYLLRTIRAHLSDANPTPFSVMATEILITTTVRVCAKDTKLLLKIRLLGMLQLLAIRILEVDRIHCTLVLLRFTCRALKSRKFLGKTNKTFQVPFCLVRIGRDFISLNAMATKQRIQQRRKRRFLRILHRLFCYGQEYFLLGESGSVKVFNKNNSCLAEVLGKGGVLKGHVILIIGVSLIEDSPES